MSEEDKQARAGTGDIHDFQKICQCFKWISQMGRDGAGTDISLGSEVNDNCGSKGSSASMAVTLAGVHRSTNCSHALERHCLGNIQDSDMLSGSFPGRTQFCRNPF